MAYNNEGNEEMGKIIQAFYRSLLPEEYDVYTFFRMFLQTKMF